MPLVKLLEGEFPNSDKLNFACVYRRQSNDRKAKFVFLSLRHANSDRTGGSYE